MKGSIIVACIVGTIAGGICFGAGAQEMTILQHNGSLMLMTRDKGHVEIRYETPRMGVPVLQGALLFSGTFDGRGIFAGTAYTFKRGCSPAPYPVVGQEAGPGIILIGDAPQRKPGSCDVLGNVSQGKNAKLVFEYEPE
jgi:hypothetical protein